MKAKVYIHIVSYEWSTKPEIFISGTDMTNAGYELLEVQEVEFEMPQDYSPIAAKIRRLENDKTIAIKALNQKIGEIEDQIKKYQGMEHSK